LSETWIDDLVQSTHLTHDHFSPIIFFNYYSLPRSHTTRTPLSHLSLPCIHTRRRARALGRGCERAVSKRAAESRRGRGRGGDLTAARAQRRAGVAVASVELRTGLPRRRALGAEQVWSRSEHAWQRWRVTTWSRPPRRGRDEQRDLLPASCTHRRR
jgi:hypothetical protein